MKIALFGIKEQEKKDYFLKSLSQYELVFFDTILSEDSLPQDNAFEVISVFVDCLVTAKVISHFPNLRYITARSTGFDNIDTTFAKSKNIPVSNVPAYGSHTVAEFTFGLILSLSRKIYQGINRIKVGCEFSFEGLRGFDLYGKTLGVVGTGKIGTNVVKIAQGFGMQILAFDLHPNEELKQSLNLVYVPLEELLKNSDITTLHVPYTEQTHHLINRQNIFLMKKGALLINTSRGAVVETDGLFQALTQEHLGGAALDVIEEEGELKEEAELLSQNRMSKDKFKNILEDHILVNLPQVITTPHMAFYSKEAEISILETTVKNINGFLEGRPENVVNQSP